MEKKSRERNISIYMCVCVCVCVCVHVYIYVCVYNWITSHSSKEIKAYVHKKSYLWFSH